ncbi:MAG TPA: heavy metal translocating P-type ATPase [Patescibacteria group bacterium]|nr:heavy metal translocating P-type ATPase [Patescibacteria group bacterium]
MKKILRAVWQYNLFFVALIAAVTALGLELGKLHTAAHWVLIVIASLELLPFFQEMYQDIRAGKYGVDILAVIAVVSSLVLKQYWAAIVIILMLLGGRALEDYAGHRAKGELEALLSRAPQKARILRGRKEIEIKASEVRNGDKLIIRPGELVPADAVIIDGTANFDESSLTGESVPQVKEEGGKLLSGSINIDGAITAKAIASAEDSQYQQIIKLVKSAQSSQAPFVRLADRYAVPFTIVSLAIAGTAWALSGDAIRFLEVIVVATPCPLILAAPIAIISGMSRSAKHGIIIKTGTSLEKLAQAKTFAFDKTGTLTRGELRVEKVATYSTYKRTEVLAYAASLERNSNHAQANAIVKKAEAEHAKSVPVKHVREIAGKGVTATSGAKEIIVGRLSLLEESGVTLPKTFKPGDHDQTTAFVAIGGVLAGALSFSDEIRPESKSVLQQLRASGVRHILMITGDNERTAKLIAKKLSITEIIAGALPGDKIRAIEGIKHRPVAFVGDGVNDAPVLTASDVGIALGARGAAAASESADVVIMLDDLAHVPQSVRIAQRSVGIAKQSVFVGIGLSVGLMFVFATGKFMPIYGAAIQEVVDVIVILNALRAHSGGNS